MEESVKPAFNKFEFLAHKEGKELAKKMSESVNGTYEKAFIAGFVTEMLYATHRTLQQSMLICMIEAIQEAADLYKKGRYDPRNEVTYKWCAEVCEKVEMWPFVRIIK